ncbi:MAG: hypothetical protein M1816_006394 [Peltula sp. TS41687]|nr:MAG: hypothetical protein M1816_006394 [Peltula sp. TS41687]
MDPYSLLDQTEEGKHSHSPRRIPQLTVLLSPLHLDSLHRSRLLSVEEKPFKRMTKRLLTPSSLLHAPSSRPSGADAPLDPRLQFRDDVLLDFAAFEHSIARIQFLLRSNERERSRYSADRSTIQATAATVRDNVGRLHAQLAEAQTALALRKSWDELTEKITGNRMLRPRRDQEANLERLNAEIAELEAERDVYVRLWGERRELFERCVAEGEGLRSLIRGVQREEEEEEEEEGETGTGAGTGAGAGSPGPAPDRDGDTPMAGDLARNGELHVDSPSADHLAVMMVGHGTPLGRSPSRGPSPVPLLLPELKEPVVDEEEEDEEDESPEDGEAREEEDVTMNTTTTTTTTAADPGEIDAGDEEEGLLTEPAGRDGSRMGSAAMSASAGKSPTPEVGGLLVDGEKDKDKETGEV